MGQAYRIDIHSHTLKLKQGDDEKREVREEEYEEYIKLLLESKIKFSAITNHNFFDEKQYKALEKNSKGKNLTFWPGIELDVTLENNKNNKHFVIFFNDKKYDEFSEFYKKLNIKNKDNVNDYTINFNDLINILKKFNVNDFLISVHSNFKDKKTGITEDEFINLKKEHNDFSWIFETSKDTEYSQMFQNREIYMISGSDFSDWKNDFNEENVAQKIPFVASEINSFNDLINIIHTKRELIKSEWYSEKQKTFIYKYGENNENKLKIKLEHGLYLILGTKGSGKTSFLEQIKKDFESQMAVETYFSNENQSSWLKELEDISKKPPTIADKNQSFLKEEIPKRFNSNEDFESLEKYDPYKFYEHFKNKKKTKFKILESELTSLKEEDEIEKLEKEIEKIKKIFDNINKLEISPNFNNEEKELINSLKKSIYKKQQKYNKEKLIKIYLIKFFNEWKSNSETLFKKDRINGEETTIAPSKNFLKYESELREQYLIKFLELKHLIEKKYEEEKSIGWISAKNGDSTLLTYFSFSDKVIKNKKNRQEEKKIIKFLGELEKNYNKKSIYSILKNGINKINSSNVNLFDKYFFEINFINENHEKIGKKGLTSLKNKKEDIIKVLSNGEIASYFLNKAINNDYKEKIVLLDEPESGLDNITIKDKIIKRLKQIKNNNYIFIATHNANIGNLDNNNLFYKIYERRDYRIFERKGTNLLIDVNDPSENKNLKETLMNILDGGEELYEKRYDKYKE